MYYHVGIRLRRAVKRSSRLLVFFTFPRRRKRQQMAARRARVDENPSFLLFDVRSDVATRRRAVTTARCWFTCGDFDVRTEYCLITLFVKQRARVFYKNFVALMAFTPYTRRTSLVERDCTCAFAYCVMIYFRFFFF